MSGNSLPWLVRSTASDISEPYTLDINYEVMERKGAGEGSNFPPVLPRPERARVTQNRSMPEERDTSMFRSQMLTSQVFPNEGGHFRYIDSPFSAGESIFGEKPPGYFPPLLWGTDDFWNPPIRNDDDSDEDDENDDEMYAVTWDWHGNIQAWLHSYTSPQDVFEPHMACRTPLSEDGMAHLVLNDADEYVLTGYSALSVPGSDSLRAPGEGDLPPQNLNLASSSSSSEEDLELRAGPARQLLRPDILEASRGNIREDSSDKMFSDEDLPLAGAQYEIFGLNPFTLQQGEAGEERARRFHIYNGSESQGSEYRTSIVLDESQRANFMPNFPPVQQQKLWKHMVGVEIGMEPLLGAKVTWFAVMAICIPILLILRGAMMWYPSIVGMWLWDLKREAVCPFREFLQSWALNRVRGHNFSL